MWWHYNSDIISSGCLQSVHYATTCLLSDARRSDHITPVLARLHWSPVRQRIVFKKSHCGVAPAYLSGYCVLATTVTGRQHLRSATAGNWSVFRQLWRQRCNRTAEFRRQHADRLEQFASASANTRQFIDGFLNAPWRRTSHSSTGAAATYSDYGARYTWLYLLTYAINTDKVRTGKILIILIVYNLVNLVNKGVNWINIWRIGLQKPVVHQKVTCIDNSLLLCYHHVPFAFN